MTSFCAQAIQAYETANKLLFDDEAERAVHLLSEALKLDPNFVEARILAAHAFTATGDHDVAIEHAKHAVWLRGDYADAKDALFVAYAGKADTAYAEERFPDAFDCMENALLAYPIHERATDILRYMWFLAERSRRAEKFVVVCQALLRSIPDWNEVRYRAGRTLLKLQRFEEAAGFLAEFSRRDERDVDGHLWLGLAYLALYKWAEAFKEYEIVKASNSAKAKEVSLIFKAASVMFPNSTQGTLDQMLNGFFQRN